MVYGSTSFVPLLKGREQQDAVTGLERDLDRAHLLAHVLRHALDGAAPQVGEQLRTGIWKSHSTLTLLATQNYPFLLKYDCPLWLK